MGPQTAIFLTFMGVLLVAGSAARAETVPAESELVISGGWDVCSQYIWRGFALYDKPVLQPSLTCEGYGTSLSLWSSMPLWGGADLYPNDEVDFTVSYRIETGLISFAAGYVACVYPYADNSIDHEIFAGISSESLLPLETVLTFYLAAGEAEEPRTYYGTLEISRSIPLWDLITADLSLHYGILGNYAFENSTGRGADVLALVKVSIPVKDGVFLIPSLGYSLPCGDIASEDRGAQKPTWLIGGSIAFGE